ncbi:MAG: Asp-tRNA(Asn)/Glu-tRNA(Gln) amidotransferase GatCAB subunit C [Bacteroidetes bacterium]|nr:MAG: Asp-tRNA(Asn)/Glu-tRNA(Gln) amidotransferase GatCAB subunit C [Bacteroidota bacterium]
MKIDNDTLDKIAKLASIKIDDNEREKLKQDMTAILEWVEKLDEIDTSTVDPITHMTGENNRVRNDEDNQNLSTEDALKNAKVKSDKYFVVPKVINKENE